MRFLQWLNYDDRFIKKQMFALEKKTVLQEKTRLTSPEVGVRRLQRFDGIQADLLCLLLDQEGKRRLCSRGAPTSAAPFIILTQANRHHSQNNSNPRRLITLRYLLFSHAFCVYKVYDM